MLLIGEYVEIKMMWEIMNVILIGGWMNKVDVWLIRWVKGIIWLMMKIWLWLLILEMVKDLVKSYR